MNDFVIMMIVIGMLCGSGTMWYAAGVTSALDLMKTAKTSGDETYRYVGMAGLVLFLIPFTMVTGFLTLVTGRALFISKYKGAWKHFALTSVAFPITSVLLLFCGIIGFIIIL